MMDVILFSKQKETEQIHLLRLFLLFFFTFADTVQSCRYPSRNRLLCFLHTKSPAAVFKYRETRPCIRESGDLQIVVADHEIHMDD